MITAVLEPFEGAIGLHRPSTSPLKFHFRAPISEWLVDVIDPWTQGLNNPGGILTPDPNQIGIKI